MIATVVVHLAISTGWATAIAWTVLIVTVVGALLWPMRKGNDR